MMPSTLTSPPQRTPSTREQRGMLVRPQTWRPADRHVRLGVSHPSDDPARHRTFEIRASYDATAKGWVAHVGEQNLNEQCGDWARLSGDGPALPFATAAACLGHAVTTIMAAVDRAADAAP